MENYIVYKITNKINGKAYIGRTKDLKKRIEQHIQMASCRAIHFAIKKYGIDKFSISVLYTSSDFNEIVSAEKSLIEEHKTLSPNGYNLILETDKGRSPSKETRQKQSKSAQKNRVTIGNSGFVGVKIEKHGFLARINFEKKTFYKYFKRAEKAAEAYDKINLYLRGVGCRLNFPEKLSDYLKEDLAQYFKQFMMKNEKSSRYKGVCFHKLTKKWQAFYTTQNKTISLGLFHSEEEAFNTAKNYYK